MTDNERKLILNDSRVCWLYGDGSHRSVTQEDCDYINTRAAPSVDVEKLARETGYRIKDDIGVWVFEQGIEIIESALLKAQGRG